MPHRVMKIELLFFGAARDLAGVHQASEELPEGETLGSLCLKVLDRFPSLGQIAGSLLLAVNQEIAGPAKILCEGDEVAFLPPVSGGEEQLLCQMTRETIDAAALAASLKTPSDGAVVLFEGIVRNNSDGRETLYLEYEAYDPMALREMDVISREAREKFPIGRLAMVHRTGRLEIGETSVAIAVASPHRAAAFEACRYAIDQLKRRAPIWKKEHFPGGASAWAKGEG